MLYWGFIGCGDVTEKKSGPAFSKVSGLKVVAVMRREGEMPASTGISAARTNWVMDRILGKV